MSSVRMCDRCGNIFSEREDGWQTFNAMTVKRSPTGRQIQVEVALDACPKCALNVDDSNAPLTPRIAGPKQKRTVATR